MGRRRRQPNAAAPNPGGAVWTATPTRSGRTVSSGHPTPAAPDCLHCRAASPRAPGPRFDWSFLDAAHCISLRERPDRAAAAAAEFHRVGLCDRVTFFRPDEHPVSIRIGIWQSHRRVAEHALGHGRSRVLIFEDDVMFVRRFGPAAVSAFGDALHALPPGLAGALPRPLAAF